MQVCSNDNYRLLRVGHLWCLCRDDQHDQISDGACPGENPSDTVPLLRRHRVSAESHHPQVRILPLLHDRGEHLLVPQLSRRLYLLQ